MASTPRAAPTDTAAGLSSPASSNRQVQGKHNRKKQRRAGSSNNGSHSRSSMCEAPEAKWPGSTVAPVEQLAQASCGGIEQEGLCAGPGSSRRRSSYDATGRCQADSNHCHCTASGSFIAAGSCRHKQAADGSSDTPGSSGCSRSNSKQSSSTGSGGDSQHQRQSAASSSSPSSGSIRPVCGSSGSGDDEDDGGDAWQRRKLAVGKSVQKQAKQQQQQGQSEDSTAANAGVDGGQQQPQQQQAAVCKLQSSRTSSPLRVNGYVKGHTTKQCRSQQPHSPMPHQPNVQLQSLSVPSPQEQHGWMPIQFGDLPCLLGTSPDCSPDAFVGSRTSRSSKGSQLQTIVSMPGIHHSSSTNCVLSSKELLVTPQQRSKSADRKQQHKASSTFAAAELASALNAATNALLASPTADRAGALQQHEGVKPLNGRTLLLQHSSKPSALENGKCSGERAQQQQQEQLRPGQLGSLSQQQQQQAPNGMQHIQVPQQAQEQLRQHPGSKNDSCPVTPSGKAGFIASKGEQHSPAPRSPQLSHALLEQFGLRVGPLNGNLLPNELQLRAAIEQAGVGAVLVAREDDQAYKASPDKLSNGDSSSAADLVARAISQASGGSGNSSNAAGKDGSAPADGSLTSSTAAGTSSSHDNHAGASSSQAAAGGASSSLQRSTQVGKSAPAAASPRSGSMQPAVSSPGGSRACKDVWVASSPQTGRGSRDASRNQQQQQASAHPPPVQLHVQVPDAGVDDCSIASSSSSIQASSTTSNPWQQHESAAAVLQLGDSNGSVSGRAHGGYTPGQGGLHPQHLYSNSAAGGLSHSSSPQLTHHMDHSDIMSDPGTVPGSGFGLGDSYNGGYSRMKPGRNRFMPNHHLGGGGGAGYYAGGGPGRHHMQEQPLLMQQFANSGGSRGASSGGRRGGRDGDDRAGRSGGGRDGDSSGRRGGGNSSSGRRNSKGGAGEYGLPRSPQVSHGPGGSRRSFDHRGGGYSGQDGSSRGNGRQTPGLPSPGGRGNRDQQRSSGYDSGRDGRSPHLAGSNSSNSLLGHPSPLLLPESAVAGPSSGRSGSSSITPMQDLPPSAATGLPPHGPSTDLERFLAVVGPTVAVDPSKPLQQVLNSLTLKSVWDLFLEPSLWGTPVGTVGGPRGPSTAYYVPYMSAMQIFTTVAEPSPTASPVPSAAANNSNAAANSDSASSSRGSSSAGSPTPSSCSSSAQSYAAVAAGSGAANAPSTSARTASAAAAAAAAASVQVGPGGRGRLYTCSVKGWPPVMRLLLEHMEQELPFSRDPFYIQLEAMSGGQEAVEAAAAAAAAAAVAASVTNAAVAGGSSSDKTTANSSAAAGGQSPSPSPAAGQQSIAAPAGGYTACGYPLIGPELMTTRLMDIHPASWFAVAWYPVYRIPDAPLTARFLAFYSFSQLLEVLNDAVSAARAELSAPCNLAGLPMPVVGMKWYNLMGERWLELLGTPGSGHPAMGAGGRRGGSAAARAAAAASNNGDSDQPVLLRLQMHPVRFKEWQARLEDLQVQASRLSKGAGLKMLTPQGPKEVRLYHSDYEFFNSRGGSDSLRS